MTSTHHPCGALPVRGWDLTIWYCERHQAWWGKTNAYRQEGVGIVGLYYRPIQWGPFDTERDVLDWCRSVLDDWQDEPLPAPGMP